MLNFVSVFVNGLTFLFCQAAGKRFYRDVAQLVAHYVRDVGVACSSHVIPTGST